MLLGKLWGITRQYGELDGKLWGIAHGTGNAQSSSCACRAQGCVRVHKKKEGPATFEWACIDDIITGESNRRKSNRRELVSPMGEQS